MKGPNYCIWEAKPNDPPAVRQVYKESPLLPPHIARILGSAASVSEAVRQIL